MTPELKDEEKHDDHVHTYPVNQGHVAHSNCWCNPELIGDYENEGGLKHYLHRENQ